MKAVEVALVPLASLVLPGGRLQVEVYPPIYQQVITEAIREVRPFAVGLEREDATCPFYPIATLVTVKDFDRPENHGLQITIEGCERIVISDAFQQSDDLWIAKGNKLANWAPIPLGSFQHLADGLKEYYKQLPDGEQHYTKANWQDAAWVCQRWLEVLPIKPRDLQALIQQSDCKPVLKFLDQLLLKSQNLV